MTTLTKSDVGALQELTASPGWKVLASELQLEIDEIENQLFSLRDDDSKKLKYNDDDLLRASRNIYITLLKSPNDILEYSNMQ